MIYVKVNGQQLESFSDQIYSDSVNYLTVRFDFFDDWKGYAVTALFRHQSGGTVSLVLDDFSGYCVGENTYLIPYEVLKTPSFTLSLIGVKDNSRITTGEITFAVKQSGFGEGEAHPFLRAADS